MKILLSFDYEIFFRINRSDCIDSLIKPTETLLELMDKHSIKSTFFVDAGYLLTLEKNRSIEKLNIELNAITNQIKRIEKLGHEIGFHVHSHWEDTTWENNEWNFNMSRYKLSDFDRYEAHTIFLKYFDHLSNITKCDIKAFRAGGWCLEPFENIRQAMIDCGIMIDSTVFVGGKRSSATHQYDFSNYPDKEIWNFHDNPSIENTQGIFKEVSISSMEMSMCSYWKYAILKMGNKLKKRNKGKGISPPIDEILTNLFSSSKMPISADSAKAEFLVKELKKRINTNKDIFSVISHPKNMDYKSMSILEGFIKYAKNDGHSFHSISEKHL